VFEEAANPMRDPLANIDRSFLRLVLEGGWSQLGPVRGGEGRVEAERCVHLDARGLSGLGLVEDTRGYLGASAASSVCLGCHGDKEGDDMVTRSS
jgi:hypothetical protein